MSCEEGNKTYINSSLDQWGAEFAHHLETGGTIKCDICREAMCDNSGFNSPAIICKSCGKGMCYGCGESHFFQPAPPTCSPSTCNYIESSLGQWGGEFAHHLSTGGSVKCDVCREALCYESQDGPAYICSLCNKGICESCMNNHS